MVMLGVDDDQVHRLLDFQIPSGTSKNPTWPTARYNISHTK